MIGRIPDEHREFAASVLDAQGIDTSDLDERRKGQLTFHHNVSGDKTDAMLLSLRIPHCAVGECLGVPPPEMFDFARRHNIKVGALVGTVNHALNQARAGVDVLIAAGGEAGGHCGAVSTMVLIPEVCRALRKHDMDVPVWQQAVLLQVSKWPPQWQWVQRAPGVAVFG